MSGRLVAAALVVALAVGACGGGDEPSSGSKTTKIDVGVLAISALAPVYLGIDKGFFADEGLEVVPHTSEGGAALLPSVVSGELDFAYSNNVSLLIAAVRGLPIQIVTNGADESDDPSETNSVLVSRKGSAIRRPKDLEGKEIAVNTLKNVGDITIKAALEKRGVDVSKLRFVEVPFPEMLAALDANRVDAVWLVSPFSEQAVAAGHQVLARPFYDTKPGLTIATYFTSKRLAQEDPEVVDRFVRAMNRSMEYTKAHPAEFRRITLKFTKIPESVVKTMPQNAFSTAVDRGELQLTAELMRKYGLIDEMPNLEELIR